LQDKQQHFAKMIIASSTLTLASVLGTALVAPSISREIVTSVNFDKDPADASLRGFDGDTFANEGQECSFNELLKVQETSDADLGIFGCDEDKYCAEDHASSRGGRCIKFDVEHEHDFDKTPLALESHRRLGVCTSIDCRITCTYSHGLWTGGQV
jgi:hypothetical protein